MEWYHQIILELHIKNEKISKMTVCMNISYVSKVMKIFKKTQQANARNTKFHTSVVHIANQYIQPHPTLPGQC